MITVTDLYSGYGKVPILNAVSFEVKEHEMVAIIGPNGAGKSTLLKTIAGLVHPSAGKVMLDGKEITGLPSYQIIFEGIAYVPEGGRVFANMSVADNLRMGAYSNRQILKEGVLDEVFALFPILKERANKFARTLSGGERQMLAIARGLVSRPKLLMLDEPSLGLAPKLVDEIYEKIKLLKESGLTVLLVEQNVAYALELADRGYVLENGRICLEGNCADLADNDHIRRAYLGL